MWCVGRRGRLRRSGFVEREGGNGNGGMIVYEFELFEDMLGCEGK